MQDGAQVSTIEWGRNFGRLIVDVAAVVAVVEAPSWVRRDVANFE